MTPSLITRNNGRLTPHVLQSTLIARPAYGGPGNRHDLWDRLKLPAMARPIEVVPNG